MKNLLYSTVIGVLTSLVMVSCLGEPEDLVVAQNEARLDVNDYLIFGTYRGFCQGGAQCVDIFKLEGEQLFEDSNDHYPGGEAPYQGNFIELSETAYQSAARITDHLPERLFLQQERFIGNPDIADQGGYYVEIRRDGIIWAWRIDTYRDATPEWLHTFLNVLDNSIDGLGSEDR